MNIESLAYIIAFVTSMVAAYVAITGARPDRILKNAQSSKLFQEMLGKEIEKGLAKDKRICEMVVELTNIKAEVKTLCDERDSLRKTRDRLQMENTKLKKWTEDLVTQIVKAEMVPVEMRKN